MSTDIRPEVSVKNKYWISRHRYYELKHFCLQYGEWKQAYNSITLLSGANLERLGEVILAIRLRGWQRNVCIIRLVWS